MFEIVAVTVAILFALLILLLNVVFLFFINRKITIFTRQYLEYSKINMGAIIDQFAKVIRVIDLNQPDNINSGENFNNGANGQLLKQYQDLVSSRGKK